MTYPKLASVKSGYGGRGYRIPGRLDDDGKQIVYPSVTTVLKQVAKPALLQWVADQTAAFATMNIGYLTQVQDEIGWRFLRFYWSRKPKEVGSEIREYYEGVKDDAAELGTNIHEWVEADIDGLSPYPDVVAIETEQMIEAWLEWFGQHDVVSHNQEFTCVNDTWRVAGTADADWTITCVHGPDEHGRFCLGVKHTYRTLVDLKSSRHTWNEHGFQLAALGSAEVVMREVLEGTDGALKAEKTERGKKIVSWWVEDAPPVRERYALLHIRPDDWSTKGDKIPAFARLIDVTDDMDLYRDGFTGALALARVQKQLKERATARKIAPLEQETEQ